MQRDRDVIRDNERRQTNGTCIERERERERERDGDESDNRVSTIKANPPATLIMVCRIDLSRSPEQTDVPTGHKRPTRSRFEIISSRGTSPSPRDGDIPRKVLHRELYGRFTAAIPSARKEMYYRRQAANSTGNTNGLG